MVFLKTVLFILLLSSCSSNSSKTITKEEKIKKGKVLFQSGACFQCHSLNSKKLYGPPLNNILNMKVTVIQNNIEKEIIIDKEYIINAILDPEKEKVIGFEKNKMPEVSLSKTQIEYLVEYIIFINEKNINK